MSKRFRRLFYYLFLFAFLISAPLVVLYTAGYRYQPGLGKIVRTGVLSLTSTPKGADVYIDRQLQSEKTPAIIDTIPAGEHLFRIEKKGYSSWEKTLMIESNLTTFASSVLLFLDQAPRLSLSQTIPLFSPSPDGSRIAFLTTTDSWVELWLFSNKDQTTTLLTRRSFSYSDSLELSWSPDGMVLLLFSPENYSESVLIPLSLEEAPSFSELVQPIQDMWWDVQRSHHLFLQNEKTLFEFDVSKGETTELFALNGTAMSATNGYYLAETISDRTVVSHRTSSETTILAYLPLGTYEFQTLPTNTFLLLYETTHQRLVLLDASGSDQPILLNTQAPLWHWENALLVYSNGFDLHVYDAEKHLDTTLTRTSEEITDLAWYPNQPYLLYSQNEIIYALELDHRGTRNITPLVQGNSIQKIWTDETGYFLYFYGKIEDKTGLYSKRLQR